MVSEARLNCLRAFWVPPEGMSESATEQLFLEDTWTILNTAIKDTAHLKAAVHPTLLNWIHRCGKVKQELTTSVLTLTSGIFLEQGDDANAVHSTAPTVPKGSIPKNAKD